MDNPLVLLLSGLGLVAVSVVLFWPKTGLVGRLRLAARSSDRTRLEDALKHAYDCEYKGVPCSLPSIAGTLDISADSAARLLTRMESMGLVRSERGVQTLTDAGRSYALRVVRIHRLWEQYLAEESGLHETEWHEEAERREHLLTPADADRLAARMGNPGFDPHGDPIPTAAGEVPVRRGVPLTDLPVGTVGRIIHLEDEPHAVYAQLVAQGIYPGMQVRILSRGVDRILFAGDEQEVALAPVTARSVTVAPAPTEDRLQEPYRTLATVPAGEPVTVRGLAHSFRGQQRRRLLDLGIVPGTRIVPELVSAGGDPVAYRVRGTLIALRRRQAEQIYVEATGEGEG